MRHQSKMKVTAFLTVASLMVSLIPMSAVFAAKKKLVPATAVEITEGYDVMVVGTKCNLDAVKTPENSTDKVKWSSSDESIAKPDAYGKFTAKKTGTVTITAKTTSGKKDTFKILVVSKLGVSSSQKKIDSMLKAKNVKNVYIKNLKTEQNYKIKKGSYLSKTLRVNAPYSDVENYGVFGLIKLFDVKDGTWKEFAKNNSFKITDKDLTFKVDKDASVASLQVNTADSKLTVESEGVVKSLVVNEKSNVAVKGEGSIKKLDIATKDKVDVVVDEKSTVKDVTVSEANDNVNIKADGAIGKVTITEKATVDITGSSKNVEVVVDKSAKGATVKSDVPVKLTLNAEVKVALGQNAKGSTIVKTDKDINAEVDNKTGAEVKVEDSTGASLDPVKKEEPETNVGGGASGGSGSTTRTETVKGDTANGNITYTLPTAVSNIIRVTANLDMDADGTMDNFITLSGTDLGRFMKLLDSTQNQSYVNIFNSSLPTPIEKNLAGCILSIQGDAGNHKKVEIKQGTASKGSYDVTLNATDSDYSLTISRVGGTNSYTVSKNGNNQLVVSTSNTEAASRLTFYVVY